MRVIIRILYFLYLTSFLIFLPFLNVQELQADIISEQTNERSEEILKDTVLIPLSNVLKKISPKIRELLPNLFQFLLIILGMVVGYLLIFKIIIPSIQEKMRKEKERNERIHKLEIKTEELDNRIRLIENQRECLKPSDKIMDISLQYKQKLEELEKKIEELEIKFPEKIDEIFLEKEKDRMFQGPLVELYNKILHSNDKKMQTEFIRRKNIMVTEIESELLEKGQAATTSEVLFCRDPNFPDRGLFLIAPVEEKFLVFPNFNVNLTSRSLPLVFNILIEEIKITGCWNVVLPAEARKVSDNKWQLTKTGIIGGEYSPNTLFRKEINQELQEIKNEILFLKEKVKDIELKRVEFSSQDIENLFFYFQEKLKENYEFRELIKEILNQGRKKIKEEIKEEKEKELEEKKIEKKEITKIKEFQKKETYQEEIKKDEDKYEYEVYTYNNFRKKNEIEHRRYKEEIKKAIEVRAESCGKEIVFTPQKGGLLFLISSEYISSSDIFFIFPDFKTNPKDIQEIFELIRESEKENEWRLFQPAFCQKISENKWKLIKKGKIIIK